MTPKTGSFYQLSPGLCTLAVGFPPSLIRFTISQTDAGPENNVAHLSTGFTDGTFQCAHSIYSNGHNAYTRYHDTFCLSHHAILSNTFKRVISASFVGTTPNGFTLDFDRATSDYLITFEAYP